MVQFVAQTDADQLLTRLGYTPTAGYVNSSLLNQIPNYRFAVSQALKDMRLVGVFGLWSNLNSGIDCVKKHFRPLVYVSDAPNDEAAKEIHKRVWSQGLVPFVLILSPSGVWSCKGFSFSSHHWEQSARKINWSDCRHAVLPDELNHFKASRLRSSLAWRQVTNETDLRMQRTQQVDSKLLSNLQRLSKIFIEGDYDLPRLKAHVANALIGRFLYVYFLKDRGIIDEAWLQRRGHTDIDFDNPHKTWSKTATWSFFDDLDSIFNGSIFPLDSVSRSQITEEHILVLRQVLRHDYERSGRSMQLSLFDIYFPTIRTETLSAVYEQFLENEGPTRREDDGAFYTPPYIVDYMLDQLENMSAIRDGVRVLDSAAGSGVFLVGAYRRIVENRLLEKLDAATLPAEELRRLLISNIFGIEKNPAACQVASFSLYLTLIDYLSDDDLRDIAQGESNEKLFPPLIPDNIVTRDFFDTQPLPSTFPAKFDCIVGNPPWQKLAKLDSKYAQKYCDSHKELPIDQGRASEIFAWKCASEHLEANGLMSLLLNIKSLISPSARRFRQEFSSKYTITGMANFSHFRYRLFIDARAPAAAIFVINRPPNMRDAVWVYSPTLASQPIDSKGWPWAIVVDKAEVQKFRYSEVMSKQRGCFEALMLRAVDRKLLEYLEDLTETDQIRKLGQLEGSLGLEVGRGGSESETGVDEAYLLGQNYLAELGLEANANLFRPAYSFPREAQSSVSETFKYRFGGWILLLTRFGKPVHLIKQPIAFCSTLFAANFKKPSSSLTAREKKFLQAMRLYLNSEFIQYAMALYGRLWLLDGRRFDIEDVKSLPIPFCSLDDARIDRILEANKEELETIVLDFFDMPHLLREAIKEFKQLRRGFQDGKVPMEAIAVPDASSIDVYVRTLAARLESFTTNPAQSFVIKVHTDSQRGVGAIALAYASLQGSRASGGLVLTMAKNAIEGYEKCGGSVFTDSLSLEYDRDSASLRLVKPLERYHWSIERAYSDSNRIFGTIATARFSG